MPTSAPAGLLAPSTAIDGRLGAPTVSADEIIARSEAATRAAIKKLKPGTYHGEASFDVPGGEVITLKAALTVDAKRGGIVVDFTGSDDRPEIVAYSTYGNTRGYVIAQLAAMMAPDIPKNEGFFESVELVVPEGCDEMITLFTVNAELLFEPLITWRR
mgnify:CR=1 FL=1